MKRLSWGAISVAIVVLMAGMLKPVYSDETIVVKLKGAEVYKGFDFRGVRYGTTFVGRVLQEIGGLEVDVGQCSTVLNYTNVENVEVCGQANDILNLRLNLVFEGGPLAGHRLVLRMIDTGETDDVQWDFAVPLCGPALYDPQCDCPENADDITTSCSDSSSAYGPVAYIPEFSLRSTWGTTLNVSHVVASGYLCHNWLYVPRWVADLEFNVP